MKRFVLRRKKSAATGQSSAGGNQTQLMRKPSVLLSVLQMKTPLLVSVWLPDMGKGDEGEQAIKFKAQIRDGATDANPFGDFTFNFDFYDNFTQNNQAGGGEVKTISDLEGKIGFTLFEQGNHGGNESYINNVRALSWSEDRTNGVALTGREYSGSNGSGWTNFCLSF